MDAKFYIKNLTSCSSNNNNNNNDNIEELDDVEKELDKIADKLLEEGVNPFSENPYGMVVPKIAIDNIAEGQQLTIIKQDDNYKYVIVEQTDTNSFGAILINEEHFNYFNNKFIKYSARDFITKSLVYYATTGNLNSLINVSDYDNNEILQAIIDTLALDGFKFVVGGMALNDIDIEKLTNNASLFFDKDETKKIFNIKRSSSGDKHIEFMVESIDNYTTHLTTDIDGNEYKELIEESL